MAYLIIQGDTTPPKISVYSTRKNLGTGETATIYFYLSEISNNFTIDDITVYGGTLSNFIKYDAVEYRATFTPTPNIIANALIKVPSYVFTDSNGLLNVDGDDSDNQVVINVKTGKYTYTGSSGDDALVKMNMSEDEIYDGGEGFDTLKYHLARDYHVIEKTSSGYQVRNIVYNGIHDYNDTVINVERLIFSTSAVALDDNAIKTMEFIGTVAPEHKYNLQARGAVLNFFDLGYELETLSSLAISIGMVPQGNDELVNFVVKNVLPNEINNQAMHGALLDYVEANGKEYFLATVMRLNLNVDLIGLESSGMHYFPAH